MSFMGVILRETEQKIGRKGSKECAIEQITWWATGIQFCYGTLRGNIGHVGLEGDGGCVKEEVQTADPPDKTSAANTTSGNHNLSKKPENLSNSKKPELKPDNRNSSPPPV